MRRAWRNAAIALFTACLLFGGLYGDRVLALTDEARALLRDYTELLTLMHEQSGDDVEFRDLVYASIRGMVRTLDPHTSFLPPEAYQNMRDRQRSSFYGLGILVGMRNGQLTVITPIEGTPASRMGIRAGDVISHIEGQPTSSMDIDDAVSQLKGPKGTQVRIHIVRTGLEEPLELTITRDEIPQNTVRYAYMMGPETGYIALYDFNRGTGREMAQAIEALRAQGMKQLLLDLRYNGGGLLDQAIEVADQFLPDGAKIVETRGRTRDSFQSYAASDRRPELGLPVVVLVNNGTASAAEILAGAIQDHDVGLVVGTPTWGKGLVQTVYSLSYGAGIAVTTAKYYTPSGRLIQRDYSSYYDYASRPEPANGQSPISTDRDVEEGITSQEAFRTDLGREVFGGGGITPDITVELADVPTYVQYLTSRNAYFDFAVEYAAGHDIGDESWTPDPSVLTQFRSWIAERGLSTPAEIEEGFAEPEGPAVSLRYVHAELFNSAFGLESRHKVLARGDEQVQRALELFDQARQLLAERDSLDVQRADLSPALGGGVD